MFAGQRLLRAEPDFVQHRYLLGDRLGRQCDYTVLEGPFAGLRLSPESWWSAGDRGSMLLGMYEREVLEELVTVSEGRSTLIDVGAADGYYAVGAVRSGLFEHAVCFEISQEGREVIDANARRNAVSDRITVLGEAERGFMGQVPSSAWDGPESAVVLIDIEGGEFDLLDHDHLQRLAGAVVIVELHEPLDAPEGRVEALIDRSAPFFDSRVITTGPRDPGALTHLSGWSDDDRWLLCSESRAYLMRWLVLTPKA